MRSLFSDDRGETIPGTLGFTLNWFCICFVFLGNVQLGQLYYRRDVVDHAAAVIADRAKKTWCATEESGAAVEQDAKSAIAPLLQTAGAEGACQVTIAPQGGEDDPGTRDLDVKLDCKFDCRIPVVSQIMCHGGSVSFKTSLKTSALGCDGKGGGA